MSKRFKTGVSIFATVGVGVLGYYVGLCVFKPTETEVTTLDENMIINYSEP